MITIVPYATDKTTTVEFREGPCAGFAFFEMSAGEKLPFSIALPSSSALELDTGRTFSGIPIHVRRAAIYTLCNCTSEPRHYHFAAEKP